MTIKTQLNGLITLIGKKGIPVVDLTTTQAQNILLALGFEKECLFDAMYEMDEQGHTEAITGLCGGFIYSNYEGVNQ